jgi:SHS family lactate transporter-like MFS transporter
MRVVGGVVAGTAADRFGRKLPLIISILWFSLFAFLCGFAQSYAMLFMLRALFGIGMGGEWAAGTPLTLEHWPARFRGVASGLLQGGYWWGYLLAAAAFAFIYPLFRTTPHLGWRVMFWLALIPASLTLWIRSGVAESPVWLEHHRAQTSHPLRANAPRVSLIRIFQHDLIGVTILTTAVIGAFMCSYYAIGFWYPTLLRDGGRSPLPYLVALNLGGVGGIALIGILSETSVGRRGATTIAALLGVASIPLYLYASGSFTMVCGALAMGAFGGGIWGVAPAYVTERFPTAARGVGPGFCYHAAAAIGSSMPVLIGALQDRGIALRNAMALAIAPSLILCVALIWLGPETRGRNFADP